MNVRAIRLLALQSAMADPQPADFVLRDIFRWYSKTFATPLHEVENLPLARVIQTYWEEQYSAMVKDDENPDMAQTLKDEIQFLIDPAGAVSSVDRQKLEEHRFNQENDAIFERQKAVRAAAPQVPDRPQVPRMGARESELPTPKPPEIKIQYIDLKELEALSEGDGYGVQPLIKP